MLPKGHSILSFFLLTIWDMAIWVFTDIRPSALPDWIKWLQSFDDEAVPVKNARVPGKGALKAIEDAPGSYVRVKA